MEVNRAWRKDAHMLCCHSDKGWDGGPPAELPHYTSDGHAR